MNGKPRIPYISDQKIDILLNRIKPLVSFELDDDLELKLDRHKKPIVSSDGGLFYIAPVHPRSESFIWDPQPMGKQLMSLKCFDVIRTYHECGALSIFKPSMAEVLAQIPNDLLDRTLGFEIVSDSVECLERHHAVLTKLYMNKSEYLKESVERTNELYS